MSKVVFSQTQRFIDIRDAIVDTCKYIAVMNAIDFNSKTEHDAIEDQVDSAFHALDYAFKDTSLGDTDARRAGKIAIYEVLRKCPDDATKWQYIEDNLDCSMVIDDVLHMMTCDSDEYEYEGGNAMYSILDKLEAA